MKSNFKPFHMKNTVKFLFVALVMTAMIACGGAKTESTETNDTTAAPATEAPATQDTTAQDTTAAPAN
jgi:hypothetical protein